MPFPHSFSFELFALKASAKLLRVFKHKQTISIRHEESNNEGEEYIENEFLNFSWCLSCIILRCRNENLRCKNFLGLLTKYSWKCEQSAHLNSIIKSMKWEFLWAWRDCKVGDVSQNVKKFMLTLWNLNIFAVHEAFIWYEKITSIMLRCTVKTQDIKREQMFV